MQSYLNFFLILETGNVFEPSGKKYFNFKVVIGCPFMLSSLYCVNVFIFSSDNFFWIVWNWSYFLSNLIQKLHSALLIFRKIAIDSSHKIQRVVESFINVWFWIFNTGKKSPPCFFWNREGKREHSLTSKELYILSCF